MQLLEPLPVGFGQRFLDVPVKDCQSGDFAAPWSLAGGIAAKDELSFVPRLQGSVTSLRQGDLDTIDDRGGSSIFVGEGEIVPRTKRDFSQVDVCRRHTETVMKT